MGENSKIEWTDHTFNPWMGCQKVSRACQHCYAEADRTRWGQADLWRGERKRTSASNWRKPLKWNADAEAAGVRARVFCASLADVFELYDEHLGLPTAGSHQWRQTMDEWRADLWALIRATPWLDWLLLTKRPQNIAAMLPEDWGEPDPVTLDRFYPNVWLGTTVENNEHTDRIHHLMQVDAAIRFLSVEPMGSDLRLTDLEYTVDDMGRADTLVYSALTGRFRWAKGGEEGFCHAIDWVIAGGESGPHATPSNPEWFRSLRDQCAEAGAPFLFKQWGEWAPEGDDRGDLCHHEHRTLSVADDLVYRIGKVAAGRTLDGQLHDGFPR